MKNILLRALGVLFCLSSYAQPAAAASTEQNGADRHAQAGVTCAQCHGEKNEFLAPDINRCSQCHNPADVEKKTKDVKPQNPHVSPHYGNTLECTLCHLQHEKPANYCAQCHSFDFKVR